ncbi:MAG: tyrosine-type recombinase/integrase, partial [Gammaproteobacteria bacterium]|nr:tyrosine-type recombinase/integrase [Gammaproteobacteria bacterium]
RRMLLTLCYGCGLRLNELVHLQVSDIDGERCLLRIDQGKGHKDRLVEMSATLLVQLRDYWRALRPLQWLFPGRDSGMPLCANTPQKYYTEAKRQAGVVKTGGIHALRHAYATHSLAAGMPITHLQHQLGHRDIRTTMRYLHWVPSYAGGAGNTDLIAALAHRHER